MSSLLQEASSFSIWFFGELWAPNCRKLDKWLPLGLLLWSILLFIDSEDLWKPFTSLNRFYFVRLIFLCKLDLIFELLLFAFFYDGPDIPPECIPFTPVSEKALTSRPPPIFFNLSCYYLLHYGVELAFICFIDIADWLKMEAPILDDFYEVTVGMIKWLSFLDWFFFSFGVQLITFIFKLGPFI